MHAESTATAAVATGLCAACGLCCDGGLFHEVALRAEDSPRALAAFGIKVKRRRGGAYFRQPCVAHAESRCTIYAERPARCRLFACRQLRLVAAGQISETTARENIRAARALVAEVTARMDRIAATNPRRALAARVANALAGADPEPAAALRAAMQALEARLERDFRVEDNPDEFA